MPDHSADFEIQVKTAYAMWPGDRVICVKVSALDLSWDTMYLVDRDDRQSELRVYRYTRPR